MLSGDSRRTTLSELSSGTTIQTPAAIHNMPRMDSSKASTSWAPLSFPSAVIFASSRGGGAGAGENDPGIATIPQKRSADPLFPLHRDVVAAAVRELLIIDKKIDHRTMKILINTDINEEDRLISDHSCEDKESVMVSRSGSDNEADFNDLRLQPKVKRLCFEVSDSKSFINPESHVVTIEGDIFNHARFGNVESVVDFIVERAILNVNSDQISSTGKEQHDFSAVSPSIRKVSDASDDMEEHKNESSTDFPTCVLSLVRSNIVVLHKSPSGSKLTKLTPQYDIGSDFTVPTSSVLSFLHNPRLHREQQDDKVFALPKFLEASIDDEYTMRARAHAIILSIMNSFRGNSMDMSLRVFLGYTSAKTPSTDRVYEILANVLFDVSHAMFAFIHTQEEMIRGMTSTEGVADIINHKIKSSLFDGRALKRIGGFEPSALLPLALGIHRCRQTKTSWEEYATSEEGRVAMSVHSPTQIEVSNHGRKRQRGAIMVNSSLFELGKKRRGRRGKSSISQL